MAERSGVEPGPHGTPLYRDGPLMAADVVTTVTELPESRVRVPAEVPAAEVERRVAQAAKHLGRNIRVPGFRAGKAPPPVIVQRMGLNAEIERLRERAARLDTVDRAAADGDFVVMDYVGTLDGTPFAGGEGRDQMVELGSGRLVPGFEEQLQGAAAGDERTVTVTFPDDYGAEELAGREAEFAVTVKEVKAKELPALDDDLAAEAGFDTLDELREDIRSRLAETETAQIDAEFREAALDSVVKNAKVEIPDALVDARARELWDQMVHSLS